MRLATHATCALLLLSGAAWAAETPEVDPPATAAPKPAADPVKLDAVFVGARAQFHAEEYAEAAAGHYDFLQMAEPTDPRFEWTELFLAEAFERAGYIQASVEYYTDVVRNRRVPVLLPDAIGALERLARSGVYDRQLVAQGVLDDLQISDKAPDLVHDFVTYLQGWNNLLRDREDWALRSFAKLRGDGLYRLRADFKTAVLRLRQGRDPEAIALFEAIAQSEPTMVVSGLYEEIVRDDARESLARLAYGAGDFHAADRWYRAVQDPQRERSHLPMERAWTRYHLGDAPGTLGLLYALSSPRYRRAFLPDRFVLRGLLYADLCHFRAAEQAVRAFRERYEPSLRAIRARADLTTDGSLHDAAQATPAVRAGREYLKRVRAEALRVNEQSEWAERALSEHLQTVYGLAEQRLERHVTRTLDAEFARLSGRLLDYEEQLNLLDYEVGIALYRRVRAGDAVLARDDRPSEVPIWGSQWFLRPADEFWNDELYSYRAMIVSKCEAGGGP